MTARQSCWCPLGITTSDHHPIASPSFGRSATMALAPVATCNYLLADNCSAAVSPLSCPFWTTLQHKASFCSSTLKLGSTEQSQKGKHLNGRRFAKLWCYKQLLCWQLCHKEITSPPCSVLLEIVLLEQIVSFCFWKAVGCYTLGEYELEKSWNPTNIIRERRDVCLLCASCPFPPIQHSHTDTWFLLEPNAVSSYRDLLCFAIINIILSQRNNMKHYLPLGGSTGEQSTETKRRLET